MEISDYTFQVLLEQITPYVNASELRDILRPTEFKPRFDKFLSRKYSNVITKPMILKVQDNKRKLVSLNYKVVIKEKADYKYDERVKSDFFKISKNGYPVREKEVLFEVEFVSMHKKIIDMIKESLAEFLATTNFGMRKNKCYGSFYISSKDEMYRDINELEILKKYTFFDNNKEYIEFTGLKQIKEVFRRLEKMIDGPAKTPFIECRSEFKATKTRAESIAIMKILKDKMGTYRLYIIPNLEVIEAIKEKKWTEDIYYKDTFKVDGISFDYSKFKKYNQID